MTNRANREKRRLAAEIDNMLQALDEDLMIADELSEDLPDEELEEIELPEDEEIDVDELDLDNDDELEELEDEDEEGIVSLDLEDDEEDIDDELEADDNADDVIDLDDEEDDLDLGEDEDIDLDDEEDIDDDELEAFIKEASEEAPGVEDEIKDTANGSEPTVQKVTDKGKGSKSEAKEIKKVVSSAVEDMDKIANYLEKIGDTKLAYKVDTISDKLETILI